MTRASRRSPHGLLVLCALAVALSVLGAPTRASAQSNVTAFMTLYGWADNSPPGPIIAHPNCANGGHGSAGGTGTFSDPVTFAAVTALLLLVSLAASTVPAYRAARLDPMETLREQ